MFAQFATTKDATLIGEVIGCLEAHDDAEQAALYPMAGNLLDDAAMI